MSSTRRTRLWHRLAAGIALVSCVVVLWFMWPARFGGSSTFVVVSGESMEPTFHSGDLLLVRERSPSVGDVIAFRIPGREGQIVHRVIDRRNDGTVLVQGDNRTSPDMPMPSDADVVGVSVLLIPRGATAVRLLTSPFVLGVGVASWIVASGVHRHRREQERVRAQRARARALAVAARASMSSISCEDGRR